MLPCTVLPRPSSSSSSLEAHLQTATLTRSSLEAHYQSYLLNRQSLEAIPRPLCPSTLRVNDLSEVPPALQENKFRREQRACAERLGESVHWLVEHDGLERLAFMSKSSGTHFYLNLELRDWVAAYDGTTLSHIKHRGDPWPRPAACPSQTLAGAELELPCRSEEFPGHAEGAYEHPYYSFTALWQQFLAARAHQRAATALPCSRRRLSLLAHRLAGCPSRARPSPAHTRQPSATRLQVAHNRRMPPPPSSWRRAL